MTDDRPDFWVRVSPTGCVYGSVRADAVGRLAEDAHREFTPRVADRLRETAQGWRIELLTRAEWVARAEPCFRNRCNHPRGGPST